MGKKRKVYDLSVLPSRRFISRAEIRSTIPNEKGNHPCMWFEINIHAPLMSRAAPSDANRNRTQGFIPELYPNEE